MRVLVVGAGAVGQVFGRHLARGGAEAWVFVKEKYADACRSGCTMYPLNRPRVARKTPVHWVPSGVLTSAAEVAAQHWDQVYLAVTSTSLRGRWFGELMSAVGDATVVLLQPGPDDRTYALQFVPGERLVQGAILFVAFGVPLPSEPPLPQPGIGYWFPPFSPTLFGGERARTDAVVTALRAGKLPARRDETLPRTADFGAAFLTPLIAHLEASGWSFDRAFATGNRRAAAAVEGARQALAVVSRRNGVPVPARFRMALSRFAVRALFGSWRMSAPFDIEACFALHFTKVRDQTREFLSRYVELGLDVGLSVDAIAALVPPDGPASPACAAREA